MANAFEGEYPILGPNIGLNPEQIRILSEQGRARIAAENAAKEAKREEKSAERTRHKGWKGKMEHGLGLLRGKTKDKEGGDSSGLGEQDERGGKVEKEIGDTTNSSWHRDVSFPNGSRKERDGDDVVR